MFMMWIILILGIILFIWIIRKFYFVQYDTILAFSGGLGSGKSLLSVKESIKLLNVNRRKVRKYNKKEYYKKMFKKDYKPNYLPEPLLYSNIPIRISKKEYSVQITDEMLLLNERQRPLSITYMDEFSSYINQFQFKNPNVDVLDEYFRFYRQYMGVNGVGSGYLIVCDQCSNMLECHLRYRINTVFNLMHFKKRFHFFYTVQCRNITISDDIKSIEDKNAEEVGKTILGMFPLRKQYDTYCYNQRYVTVPYGKIQRYTKLKVNRVLKVPDKKFESLTNDKD